MPFTVIQAHDSLQLVDESGVYTELTIPAGVTLATDRPPRWVLFNRQAILVNTPDQPLIIGGDGTVRIMSPRAPRTGAVLSVGGAGALTGTYSGVRYTFVTKDAEGNVLSESDYSPISTGTAVLTSDMLKAANLDVSPDTITARRLYRPTTNGATLFQWVELDGNTLTQIEDDLSDAGLSLIAAPTLGTPPYLTHAATFRGRVFGAGPDDLDHVRYSEAGIRYAWPSDNLIEIGTPGSDQIGITGFLQRREALGVGRENMLVQITGTGAEDDDTGSIDLDPVIVSAELGITSQESVSVFRDVGHFLWQDGVYRWGPDGVACVSDGSPDGKGNVRSWFATDDYFDRSRFSEAFGQIDPITYRYRLHLYDPDGALWWVELDLKDGTWWGPHKTDLFVPRSNFIVQVGGLRIPMIGGADGEIYRAWATRTDGDGGGSDIAHAIALDVIGKRHDMKEPTLKKFFGNLKMLGRTQSAGRLRVLTIAGDKDATRTKTHQYNMRLPHESLGICGTGKHLQVRFQQETIGQDVELHGYEVDPVHGIGER